MSQSIRLKKVTVNDPMTRLAVSVRTSTMTMLEEYQAHYRATYGEEIERSQLVEEILREFILGDKAFVKAQSTPKKADKPAKADKSES